MNVMIETEESTVGGFQKRAAMLFPSNFVFLKFQIPIQPSKISSKCVSQNFSGIGTGLSKIRTLLAYDIEKIIGTISKLGPNAQTIFSKLTLFLSNYPLCS